MKKETKMRVSLIFTDVVRPILRRTLSHQNPFIMEFYYALLWLTQRITLYFANCSRIFLNNSFIKILCSIQWHITLLLVALLFTAVFVGWHRKNWARRKLNLAKWYSWVFFVNQRVAGRLFCTWCSKVLALNAHIAISEQSNLPLKQNVTLFFTSIM